MTISRFKIKNFTVFDAAETDFVPGVNILLGENGTGKSHVLKLLWAMLSARAAGSKREVAEALAGAFGLPPEHLASLLHLRNPRHPAILRVALGEARLKVTIRSPEERDKPAFEAEGFGAAEAPAGPPLYLPSREMLSLFPLLRAAFENSAVARDATLESLLQWLAREPLALLDPALHTVRERLAEVLDGTVLLQNNGRFAVQRGESTLLDAGLLSEGMRKVAMLARLLDVGAIVPGGALFWDEPEGDLNPRLTRMIAGILRDLAAAGVQVFASTHDYLLSSELSLSAEYNQAPNVATRFFSLRREAALPGEPENPVRIESGGTLAELPHNAILEEFAAFYDREQQLFYEREEEEGVRWEDPVL